MNVDIQVAWITSIVSFAGVIGLAVWNFITSKRTKKIEQRFEKANYVSKVRFDAEFALYRELSEKAHILVHSIKGMFYNGKYQDEAQDVIREYYNDNFKNKNVFKEFAETLYRNAPFIEKTMHDKYRELMFKCRDNLNYYEENGLYDIGTANIPNEIVDKVAEMDNFHRQIVDNVREYLSKLEVIE